MRTDDRSLTAVEQTYLKQYCSLIHGQAIIDATLAIRSDHHLSGSDIASVTLEVFQGAYDFAGGGSYGDKERPSTKEQADYNLKYLSAVALLDGQVGPEQLETERINRADVQDLLSRVDVKPAPDLTAAYPERTSARVHVVLRDGRTCLAKSLISKARRRDRCRGIAWSRSSTGSPSRSSTMRYVPRSFPPSRVRPDLGLRTRRPVVGGEPDAEAWLAQGAGSDRADTVDIQTASM